MRIGILNGIAVAVAVLLLAIGGPWLVRELRTLPHHGTLAARADQRVVTLEVGGMTCAGCAGAVKERLSQVAGVSTAEVRYAQNRAYVVCERAVPDTALVGAVHRAGPGFIATVAVD